MAKKKEENKESFGDLTRSLLVAVVLAILFRSFAFEPFYIPSGSMKSTLLVGDYVFVSKYAYGYSRYSLPLGLPLFKGRIMEEEPKRGDVIVFKLPYNTSVNYIKRMVGLPGDKIQVRNGRLFINDKILPLKRIENFLDKDNQGNIISIPQYIETLPNGVEYTILDQDKNGALDNTEVYEVPSGHYFFMGDNRDNSQDSRVIDRVGFVPKENIMGPARWVFFSSRKSFLEFWEWPSSLRLERFFSFIR